MNDKFFRNLPNDVREGELIDIFKRYGRILNVDIKWPPKPPPFAFIKYEDPRDAEDAVREEDQKTLAGARMRVSPIALFYNLRLLITECQISRKVLHLIL